MLAMTSKIGIYVPTGYLPYVGVSVFCQGPAWAVLWGKISVSDLIQGRFFSCFPQRLTQVRWFSCSLVYQGSRDSHCFLQVAPVHQHCVTSHSCIDGGRSGSECLENCKWLGEYGLPFWDPLSCCCLCGFWKRHWDSMEELIEFQISCYITHSMMPLHTNIIHCWNNDKVNLAIRFRSQKKKNLSARIADP